MDDLHIDTCVCFFFHQSGLNVLARNINYWLIWCFLKKEFYSFPSFFVRHTLPLILVFHVFSIFMGQDAYMPETKRLADTPAKLFYVITDSSPAGFFFAHPGGILDQILGCSLWNPTLLLPCQVPEGHGEETRKSQQTHKGHGLHFFRRFQGLLFVWKDQDNRI